MSEPSLRILRTVSELRAWADAARQAGQQVGIVPTMGALHEGHLTLIREARRHAEQVVVSVFVNPTQFGPSEDFAAYPRTLDRDARQAQSAGAQAVFAPAAHEMYPEGEQTRVQVGLLSETLCGKSRPGHFSGVATIVSKLWAAVGPAVAVFGKKDYQQLQIIRRMTRDLLFPIEIIGVPTVREPDGVALSSRNSYLSTEQRIQARAIPRSLQQVSRAYEQGERSVSALLGLVREQLEQAALRIDYVELADPDSVQVWEEGAQLPGPALLALAAFAGSTRLIDNLVLGQDAPPSLGE